MDNFHNLFVLLCLSVSYHSFTNSAKDIYKSPNVKTALFTELDIMRSCWNQEEINVLHTRMIMQDLIPHKVPRDVHHLLKYLSSVKEIALLHSPEGKVRDIMITALSDVLGGYLQSVAIPIAKKNFYAGNLDYATMSKIYEMFNEMKQRLQTNGGRWSKPIDMNTFPVKVEALNLLTSDSELACKALVILPDDKCIPGMSKIAIPYLDYDEKPGAIVLPLKSRNLFSLKTAASSYIIIRFYILARKCLSEMPHGSTEEFNYHFMEWLTKKVVPHMYDDIWYPGFGGVLRIVETVNKTELMNIYQRQLKTNYSSLEVSLLDNSAPGLLDTLKTHKEVWIPIIIFICILTILIMCMCCYYCYSSYLKKVAIRGSKSSSSTLHALLSIYCGLKDRDGSKEKPEIQSLMSDEDSDSSI